jgi:hypothetical protein
MAKLTLASEPTFTASVAIPVPGASAPVPFRVTFKYRTRDELEAHIKHTRDHADEIDDVELVLGVAEGWELDEPFNKENVAKLLQKYHAAAQAITVAYIDELTKARVKN